MRVELVGVGHQVGEGSQIDAHMGTPREDDVQVRVGDREARAHKVVLAIEHLVVHVCELLLVEGGDVLTDFGGKGWVEEMAYGAVHLRCGIV